MNKRHYEHTLPNIRGSLSNTYHSSADNHRKTFNDISLQELADSIREMGSYKPLPYVHARQAVTKSSTANAATVPHCLQEQRR